MDIGEGLLHLATMAVLVVAASFAVTLAIITLTVGALTFATRRRRR